ncbi:HAD family hydrolase [Candidatus Micrarchaeota archaeon]|nr:HAD family hydrolase [Candidatus Micrarchaeota archaeon]
MHGFVVCLNVFPGAWIVLVKAILFDMDGVVLDSVDANVRLFQRVFQEFGFAPPSEKELLTFSPRGSRATLSEFLPVYEKGNEELKQQMFARTRELSHEMLKQLKPMEGILELLKQLKQSHCLALVTNRRDSTHEAIKLFGFQGVFDVVITADDVANPKPSPEPILLALEKLATPASSALFFGDMDVDLEAGASAGVKTILVKNVDSIKKALQTEGVLNDSL